ncbi:N-acetylmuramoyl-L-alanine amidase [Streptomyces sp. SID7499]|uniref:N-acetylmuramoyl-L-alanine amidase n=1 Tax=Streptomyces sp. SID7499 TaxID=2706086 RepID=A0A6G3X2S0_9ACTN|nr:N-acetylmuramoyl-L-alanine amidase [Streptomyces sp. SID7499]
MKLVTRAQWGARDYRLPNGATLYSGQRRGVKLHYLGTPYTDRQHTQCAAYVRQIQSQHMDGNGWSDLGYSFLVCTHGYVYEGRGLRRRNSANGNTTLNNQDYAVLLMVGSAGLTKPTDEQLHGARDAIDYCRSEGPAGAWLGGHRDGYATSCPGDAVYAWARAGAPRPAAPTVPQPPQEEEMKLSDQIRLGDWIPKYWPTDKGLQDRQIPVDVALGSGYAHSRKAAENTTAILAQLGAQQATIDKLVDAIGTGGGLTAAEIKAAAEAGAQAALDRLGDALKEN